MNISRERLAFFLQNMKKQNINWAIVPTDDYHLSEYPADCFKAREWLSGFTGTNGTLLVSDRFLGLWTDGRYFIQAEKELEGSGITLMKMGEEGVPKLRDFLAENTERFDNVWVDGKAISVSDLLELKEALKEKDIFVNTELDLLEGVWEDRPPMPSSKVWFLDDEYAGESYESKVSRLREAVKASGASGIVLSKLDDIAWLYNLRAGDIAYTPVKLAYSIVTEEHAVIYSDMDDEACAVLNDKGVYIMPYENIFDDLKRIDLELLIDPASSSFALLKCMKAPILKTNPIELMKAVKNDAEASNERVAHIYDGIALTEAIYHIKNLTESGEIYDETELSIERYLTDLRRRESSFIDLSFASIVATGENAAIIHYEPTGKTNKKIEQGFLLIDTGAHYLRGTTDVTRTVSVGETSYEMKKLYTAVLKGHLSVMAAAFREDTPTYILDEAARKPLRELGYDYRHGTGHGVGYVLSVHEGGCGIRMKPKTQGEANITYLKPNMITSDEPGVYLEGKFGIRIENLVLTRESSGILSFEALTMAPYDRASILVGDLTDSELRVLNDYHAKVYSRLGHFVSEETRAWLEKETSALTK